LKKFFSLLWPRPVLFFAVPPRSSTALWGEGRKKSVSVAESMNVRQT
jgi:hypothetical protein